MISRAKRWLAHERAPYWIAFLAAVLLIPTLVTGPMLDDHAHRASFHSDFLKPAGPRGDWDLFRFLDADPDTLKQVLDRGIFPWWTVSGFKIAFFRPLASYWHALDYRVWPDAHWLMHFGSVVAYALTVIGAGLFYRRLLGATACAGLATFMFAVDDAHSMVLTWIANRHAIVSTGFGIAALLMHDRARRDGSRSGRILAPLCLAASLFAGESGVSTVAYLVSYAIFLDREPLRARLVAYWPHVAAALVWFVGYKLGDYGAAGGAFYIDPIGQPRDFFSAMTTRMPILMAAQLAAPPADAWMALPPGKTAGFVTVCVVVVLVVLGACFAALRRDRNAGFFALGMALCLLPACATWPSDRLLLFSGLGGFGLVASLLSSPREGLSWPTRFSLGAITSVLFLLHVVVAPLFLPLRAYGTGKMLNGFTERAIQSLPPAEALEGRTLVVVSAPDAIVTNMAIAARINEKKTPPETLRVLAPVVEGEMTVERADERTLSIRLSHGFWKESTSKVFRDPKKTPLNVGDRIVLKGLTIEVKSLVPNDVLPERIDFHFDKPLEDPSFVFVVWNGRQFELFVPPQIGQSRDLPVASYQQSIGG